MSTSQLANHHNLAPKPSDKARFFLVTLVSFALISIVVWLLLIRITANRDIFDS